MIVDEKGTWIVGTRKRMITEGRKSHREMKIMIDVIGIVITEIEMIEAGRVNIAVKGQEIVETMGKVVGRKVVVVAIMVGIEIVKVTDIKAVVDTIN